MTKKLQEKLNFVTEEQRAQAMLQLERSLGWKLLKIVIQDGQLLTLRQKLVKYEKKYLESYHETLDEIRNLQYKIKVIKYKISLLEEILELPKIMLESYSQEEDETFDPYTTDKEMTEELRTKKDK